MTSSILLHSTWERGIVCVVLLATATLGAGGEGPVREIPDVKTIEQLEKTEPILLPRGVEVRLGLGEAGAEAAPWKLLYCQWDSRGKGEKPKPTDRRYALGEPLGPVYWTLDPEGPTRLEQARKWEAGGTGPAKGLHCAVIPAAWEGRFVLRVLAEDHKVIQQRLLAAEKPPPCEWQPFAELRRGAEVRGACVARRKSFAAIPRTEGHARVWPPYGLSWDRQSRGTPLPGRIPVEAPWNSVLTKELIVAPAAGGGTHVPRQPLKLSIEKSVFVVRSDETMQEWPDLFLLARWWVDGKPVAAERSDAAELIQLGRQVTYAKELRVGMGWPDALGQLKAGDTVGLQVLYSPCVYRQLPKAWPGWDENVPMFQLDGSTSALPRLSNRLDFAVTPDLLAARAKGNVEP